MKTETATATPPTDPQTIAGWFAGRLPDGWFTGTPDVRVEDDQILVTGTLAPGVFAEGASAEAQRGFEAGRISRFREQTRAERIHIARHAERQFNKPVTWAVRLGGTEQTFTRGGGGWNHGSEGGHREGGPSVTVRGRRHGVVNPQVF